MNAEHSKTMAGVLVEVGREFPDKMKNPVMMYKSMSRQGADFLSPRALVIGLPSRLDSKDVRPVVYDRMLNGDSILSFNGTPGQSGYNALEIMHFDSVNSKFVFREITFKKEGRVEEDQRDDVELETPDFIISKQNPGRCLVCHSEGSPHPLFENYPKWPGAYFSNEDTHHYSIPPNVALNGFGKLIRLTGRNFEAERWNEFAPKLVSDARYSSVKFDSAYLNFSPNAYLNLMLETANAKRIAHIIAAHPRLNEFVDVIFVALGEYNRGVLEDIMIKIPELKAKLKSSFVVAYGAELETAKQQIRIFGHENVQPGTMFSEVDKQKDLSYFSDSLRIDRMDLAEKMAFKQATASSSLASWAILMALDEHLHGGLRTVDWGLSPTGAQPFRSEYFTTQTDIWHFLASELKEHRADVKIPQAGPDGMSEEDAQATLSRFFN
jgi:hypothetical protein